MSDIQHTREMRWDNKLVGGSRSSYRRGESQREILVLDDEGNEGDEDRADSPEILCAPELCGLRLLVSMKSTFA